MKPREKVGVPVHVQVKVPIGGLTVGLGEVQIESMEGDGVQPTIELGVKLTVEPEVQPTNEPGVQLTVELELMEDAEDQSIIKLDMIQWYNVSI